MSRLAAKSFTRAKNFIKQNARPLDRRRFEFLFENGSPADVLDALTMYQNEDGGFGNALEPDFRLPDSSPVATSVALQVARQVGATYEHPLVEYALRYLLSSYDEAAKRWPAVSAKVNDYPHAPWWKYDSVTKKTEPESFANPSAELVGYLHAWSPLVPPDFLSSVTVRAVEQLLAAPDSLDMHDALCYLRLANELAGNEKARVVEKLTRVINTIVARDPAQWNSYGPQPLLFAPTPDSPFAESLHDVLNLNLDYQIAQQNADGSWSPNWSWDELYPETWPTAEREWRGNLSVDTLKLLKAYGRIE